MKLPVQTASVTRNQTANVIRGVLANSFLAAPIFTTTKAARGSVICGVCELLGCDCDRSGSKPKCINCPENLAGFTTAVFI